MEHIHGYPHSKKAEFYKLLLDYDESLERDLADCRAIWYESGTQNLMVGDYGMSDRIEAVVISKKFGFIERLVENDKINLNDSDLLTLSSELGCAVNYDIVIMVLSVKDNPIEYLCSILKE